jgi:dipeptidyl aminopeptidase/acylaminoacyl peptidase
MESGLATAGTVGAPPLDAYGELPRIEDAAISPNGTKTAAIVQAKGERRVVVVDDADKPLLNMAAGTSKVRAIEWADDATILVTNSATVPVAGFMASKYELTGTIIVPMTPDGVSGIVFGKTPEIADTTRGRFGMRTIGGRTVGYFGGIAYESSGNGGYYVKSGATTLYAVDLKTNRPRMVALAAPDGHYRDWLVDAAGKVAVTMDLAENTGLWKISIPHGAELARGMDPTGDVSLMSFGHDGKTVIYQIEDQAGTARWFEVPLAGGTATEILSGIGIDRTFVDRETGNFMGYRTSDDEPKVVMFDPVQESALSRIFRAFKGREARLIDWTPGFSKVIVRTTGSGDSGTWYMVDVAKRSAVPIGDERPLIAPEQVGPIAMVNFTAQDGLAMNGVLTLPPGREAKNLPVILLPHGGPASHDSPEFDWWAQAFASRGYAVLQPNFRGSTGGSDAFRHAGDGQWGLKMQTDISDGLAELVKRGIADPKRACIVGASYGGYAALAGVTLQKGLYRCAVSVAGVADLKLMYMTDVRESGRSMVLTKSLREQLGDPEHYDKVSPRRFAADADAPVLLIHGKDDTVVPFRQSQVMANALKEAKKPYELVTLAGEDHWLSREETRKRMLAEAMRFVQKYNPAD